MPKDVLAQANASKDALHASLHPERMNYIKVEGRDNTRVLRRGEWVPCHHYIRERLAACRQWCRSWAPRLATVGVEVIVLRQCTGAVVFLREASPKPKRDPWKPTDADLASGFKDTSHPPGFVAASEDVGQVAGVSGGDAMREIALRKPVRADDKWTIARIASVPEYRERCRRILEILTDQQVDAVTDPASVEDRRAVRHGQ